MGKAKDVARMKKTRRPLARNAVAHEVEHEKVLGDSEMSLNAMNNNQQFTVELERLLTGAQLPALPQSAVSILEISQDPRNGPAEFAAAIEADPGLTGQVLRFVNSSYFGFSCKISNIKLAITLVGTRTIKNFSLWNAVFSLMPSSRSGALDLKILWQDSLRRALFARATAKQIGFKGCEEVFAAALLQDMAVPLVARGIPAVYEKLLAARAQGRRLSEIERETLGWTHAEAGGIIARQWNLPEDFAALVESHAEIERWSKGGEDQVGKLIVALSALLPSATDAQWTEFEQFKSFFKETIIFGGPKIAVLVAQTDAEFSEFSPLLNISAPKRPLLDYLQQTAVAVG
jgi:HD-like signal output (HDOD) protein